MQERVAISIVWLALILAADAGEHGAGAQIGSGPDATVANGPVADGMADPKLDLTPAQRQAIYKTVSGDRSKVAPRRFTAVVGADVPPMIELYALPDDAVADNPAIKLYKYTMVQDQVVLVDPTKMRVIEVIGPAGDR